MDPTLLLPRARREGNPLIDGDQVTFVARGKFPPQLMGDWTGWESGPPVTLDAAAPGVWSHTTIFPRDAYLEYCFLRGERRVSDPFNPRSVNNGIGGRNQYFFMPGAASTPLARRRPHVSHGLVTRHVIEAPWLVARGRRTVHLYHPPADHPVPLVVVFDGNDFLRRGRLTTIVDNLIAERRIEPVALALVDHGGAARALEYMCSEATVLFIASAVLTLARQNLNLVDVRSDPGAYGVIGASLGGLISLYAALRLPHVYGRVLSLSGAFDMQGYETVVYPLVREQPVQPLKIWMSVGRYEGLLETNRMLSELLRRRDYAVSYQEYAGGHNYTSWRDVLWKGLEELYPPDAG